MNPADIKQARQEARLTQAGAASLVGVALRTWQHWEYGDRKMPESAWRLFQILAVNSLRIRKLQAEVARLTEDRDIWLKIASEKQRRIERYRLESSRTSGTKCDTGNT